MYLLLRQHKTISLGKEINSKYMFQIQTTTKVAEERALTAPPCVRFSSYLNNTKVAMTETFRQFNYSLYVALFVRMAIPTIYQTFRWFTFGLRFLIC